MVRSFVAVGIAADVRRHLAEAQQQLKAARARARWVRAGNLHVTVKFLGDIAEQRVPDVLDALGRAAGGIEPFVMRVQGLGAFPGLRRPRVVWAGVTDGAEQSARLAQGVERELAPLGFSREKRPFAAHITLGRVKSFVGVSALAELIAAHGDTEFGTVRVDEVTLMRSELRPDGAVYSVLGQAPLSR
ncbi:MAG: RNA 2',3'-cyclic phosphodiesterase [Armatimonadota bacterium]